MNTLAMSMSTLTNCTLTDLCGSARDRDAYRNDHVNDQKSDAA